MMMNPRTKRCSKGGMKNLENIFGIGSHEVIEFDYVNWKGVKSKRKVKVGDLYFGSNEYHTEPQFLLHCYDLEKNKDRMFAIKDMSNVKKI
jgi:hypothetical protein